MPRSRHILPLALVCALAMSLISVNAWAQAGAAS